MRIIRFKCSECRAALTSADGIEAGTSIICPKCKQKFKVTAPAKGLTTTSQSQKLHRDDPTMMTTSRVRRSGAADEDEPVDRSIRKKKRRRKKDEGLKNNVWVRVGVLGTLVVVLCVLSYFLFLKNKDDAPKVASNNSGGTAKPVEPDKSRGKKPKANKAGPDANQAARDNERLKTFTSDEGRFQIGFPGVPKEKTYQVDGLNVKQFSVGGIGFAYGIEFADLPVLKNAPDVQVKVALDELQKKAIAMFGGRSTNESIIELDGKYPGREFTIVTNDELTRLRLYLVGEREYLLQVRGKKAIVESAEAEEFLDSFKLTE